MSEPTFGWRFSSSGVIMQYEVVKWTACKVFYRAHGFTHQEFKSVTQPFRHRWFDKKKDAIQFRLGYLTEQVADHERKLARAKLMLDDPNPILMIQAESAVPLTGEIRL